jgi:hypothetical protein
MSAGTYEPENFTSKDLYTLLTTDFHIFQLKDNAEATLKNLETSKNIDEQQAYHNFRLRLCQFFTYITCVRQSLQQQQKAQAIHLAIKMTQDKLTEILKPLGPNYVIFSDTNENKVGHRGTAHTQNQTLFTDTETETDNGEAARLVGLKRFGGMGSANPYLVNMRF